MCVCVCVCALPCALGALCACALSVELMVFTSEDLCFSIRSIEPRWINDGWPLMFADRAITRNASILGRTHEVSSQLSTASLQREWAKASYFHTSPLQQPLNSLSMTWCHSLMMDAQRPPFTLLLHTVNHLQSRTVSLSSRLRNVWRHNRHQLQSRPDLSISDPSWVYSARSLPYKVGILRVNDVSYEIHTGRILFLLAAS